MVAVTVALVVENRVSIVATVAVAAAATAVEEVPGPDFLAKFTCTGTYTHMCVYKPFYPFNTLPFLHLDFMFQFQFHLLIVPFITMLNI